MINDIDTKLWHLWELRTLAIIDLAKKIDIWQHLQKTNMLRKGLYVIIRQNKLVAILCFFTHCNNSVSQ